MEQVTEALGNPTALLIERIFWIGLGGFLGLAIITSVLRGINESKHNINPQQKKELENLAEKATQKNL